MESPRKNNDCYFYYYSKCTKGDTCTFRHEPSALGCETVCSFWKEGKCLNVHCSFRHMELRKNRKAIQCYWETQPGGCLKLHCPFAHKSTRDLGAAENLVESTDLSAQEFNKGLAGQSSSQNVESDRRSSQCSETNFGSPTVDPLVVNFEEESDNESAPAHSPVKLNQSRVVKVKTLEEIRLEKVQAESAAYYSYPGADELTIELCPQQTDFEKANDLRKRIMKRLNLPVEEPQTVEEDVEILSLNEIRKRRKRQLDFGPAPTRQKFTNKRQKTNVNLSKKSMVDINEIKIKTLAEIRAEKGEGTSKRQHSPISFQNREKVQRLEDTCSEVSSTSNTECEEKEKHGESDDEVVEKRQRKVSSTSELIVVPATLDLSMKNSDTSSRLGSVEDSDLASSEDKSAENVVVAEDANTRLTRLDSNNKINEILLLDDEDIDNSGVSLRAEEDILKDIDDLLNA